MPKRINDGIKKRCSHGRRAWPKCPCPWHFNFHHGGVEHRYSLDVVARARGQKPPRTKSDAATLRDALRSEIRAGTFADPTAPPPAAPTDARLTFGDVADRYLADYVRVPTRRPGARQTMESHVALLRRTEIPAANAATVHLGAKPLDAITKADVEAIRGARRAHAQQGRTTLAKVDELLARAHQAVDADAARAFHDEARMLRRQARCRPGVKGGEVGINRLLARLRHVFSWAIEQGYIAETPFKRGAITVVRLETRAETVRTRRLDAGEEQRLLAHAGPHLRALIVAALSTGCRQGELLSLQWHQVRRDEQGAARWLVLPPERTKTNEARVIPVGPRLRAELEMRRHAPDGREHPLTTHVFGNECGERVGSIKTAWRATCRRAGIEGLHFHDLRREFGSRLLESGASEHDVRDFLGHANITTTSRYLRSTPLRLERALNRLDPEPPSTSRSIRTPFAHQADEVSPTPAAPLASDPPNTLM